MSKTRVDDLVDILGEQYAKIENTFVIQNNIQLTKGMEKPSTWKNTQLNDFPQFKNKLTKEAKAQIKSLNEKTEKIVLLNYKLVDDDSVKIEKGEIVAYNVPKNVQGQITRMQKENVAQVLVLASLAFSTHKKNVQAVSAKYKTMFEGSLPETEKLFKAIQHQMTIGVDKGLMVQYKDGKQFSWKAYMEMNTRTTLQHEIGEQQIKFGTKIGQVFYICDSYADCAEDHAQYQGKIYYNANVPLTDEIKRFIKSRKILSMQEVRDNKPWLTTRPNCRHNFHAIPLSDAMGMSAQAILNNEGLAKGPYKDSNYKKLQEQRYIERTIRKYKMRKENGEALYKATGNKKFKPTGREDALIKAWQLRARNIVKQNPTLLKRDYDRENIRVITQDLGVRYYANKKHSN